VLNIQSHKENANQNNTEILPHPNQSGDYQENKQQVLARMWGEKKPYTLLVER
jgi:hypothetical protein